MCGTYASVAYVGGLCVRAICTLVYSGEVAPHQLVGSGGVVMGERHCVIYSRRSDADGGRVGLWPPASLLLTSSICFSPLAPGRFSGRLFPCYI
jgi:hypothetical protein